VRSYLRLKKCGASIIINTSSAGTQQKACC
jgi:hypothetical protein